MSLISYKVIKIYIPNRNAEDEAALAKIIELMKDYIPVGRVGTYDGVYALQENTEGYCPGEESNPAYGQRGQSVQCPGRVLTTYAPEDIEKSVLQDFISHVVEIHPWEHPLIEVYDKLGVRIWEKA